MFGKVISAAVLASLCGALPAFADLARPAEMPPASFKGQQYVDSRGCVFLRAGYAGQVTWVPRVTRDRKQLCGYGASGPIEVAEAPQAPVGVPAAPKAAPAAKAAAPKAPAVVATAPVAAPLSKTARVVAVPTSERVAEAPAVTAGEGYRLACPADAPVAKRYEVHGGGSKLLCTKGDGTMTGATFPKLVAGNLDAAAGGQAAVAAAPSARSAEVAQPKAPVKSAKLPMDAPPAGYKMAWTDDRLNPYRGQQTAEGVGAMDQVWTRTTPAELVEDSVTKRRPVKIVVRHRDGSSSTEDGYVLSMKSGEKLVTKSSMAAPAKAKAKETGKGLFVQVGTFGVPSNADGAAGQLRGKGLPVARAKLKNGALTVVYAGPFGSADQAKAALSAARGLGFGDARIVQ
ncbi:SPOR domain-containing protein [Xinfangfangia sp. CPCC 101601]|uniref:SPOR domain-containing protein n=1 Tax=Pseudogemmobacter lacusdianii TaxID=3069608 RepID=A0ABU0VST7_9RHOB|nr:SPOR domain-containing protein [Xinfangfangia sp. CPCC 101601]MDQ2064789.1 SPOR domain-containing protein [Xinfangfangia sp. CPCC 101601]